MKRIISLVIVITICLSLSFDVCAMSLNFTEPQNLTVTPGYHTNGMLYFEIKYESGKDAEEVFNNQDLQNEITTIVTEVDYRIDGGLWRSEKLGFDQWISPWFPEFSYENNKLISTYEFFDWADDSLMMKEKNFLGNHSVDFRLRYHIYNVTYDKNEEFYSSWSKPVSCVNPSENKTQTQFESAPSSYDRKNASSWAIELLDRGLNYGLITDRIQDNMSRSITREEFAEIAVKLYENYTGQKAFAGNMSFNDTNNTEVLKAANLGLVTGVGNNNFDPDGTLTRAQMATILYRVSEVIKPEDDFSTYGMNKFNDDGLIADWANEGVYYCVKIGVISGVGNNTFDPDSNATREQAVVICTRIYDEKAGLPINQPVVQTQAETAQSKLKLPEYFPKNIPFTDDASVIILNDASAQTFGNQSISVIYASNKPRNEIIELYKNFVSTYGRDTVELNIEDYILTTELDEGKFTFSFTADGYVIASIYPKDGVFTQNIAKNTADITKIDTSKTIPIKSTNDFRLSAGTVAGDNCYNSISVVKNDGEVWGFGRALTVKNVDGSLSPVKINENIKLTETINGSLFAGTGYFYIDNNNNLISEGHDESGRLGNGNVDGVWNKYFEKQTILTNVRYVTSSTVNSLAITYDNELYLWGNNFNKIVANDDTLNFSTPQKVLDNVVFAALSDSAVFVVRSDGGLISWGYGGNGQLGDGAVVKNRTIDNAYKIMDDVKEVYASTYGAVGAVKTDKSLWMWGDNFYGQLGNGVYTGGASVEHDDIIKGYTPCKILDNVEKIDIATNTIALKTDGTVWVWGDNQAGQCGINSSILI